MKMHLLAVSTVLIPALTISLAAQQAKKPVATHRTEARKSVEAGKPGEQKVALIVFQEAVTHTNEFQRGLAEVQKKFAPRREQLEALKQEVEKQMKELEGQGDKMSQEEREERLKKIEEKRARGEKQLESAQKDYQEELQKRFESLGPKVGAIVTAYAREHGYTAVLDVSDKQGPQLVLWADSRYDITTPVVEAYNKKSGIAPLALPPASKTAPEAPAKH